MDKSELRMERDQFNKGEPTTADSKNVLFVSRNGKTYEKRLAGYEENPLSVPELIEQKKREQGSLSYSHRLWTSIKHLTFGAYNNTERRSPDADFCACSYLKLSRGLTAYRFIEPALTAEDEMEKLPLIVCLHGVSTASYLYADLADLLMNCDQGPHCRILVFDFYGHGRSPWNGTTCSLDLFVTQLKELLDVLGFADRPVALIGYDMGANVAVGFAAKFPDSCISLTLLSPLGIKYRPLDQGREKIYKRKYVGEYLMMRNKKKLPEDQKKEFFNDDLNGPNGALVQKQITMTQWQIDNSPGFLGSILSLYRYFPLRGMEELYTAVGRFPRPVLIILGQDDEMAPFKRCLRAFEDCFPNATIIDITEAGHNIIYEKFSTVASEVLAFQQSTLSDQLLLGIDDIGIN